MSILSIPNVFVSGTTINAAPFNANFNAVVTSVNNIDNSNIGAAGIFASQLLPTNAAQATFGGTLAYNFTSGFNNVLAGVVTAGVNGTTGVGFFGPAPAAAATNSNGFLTVAQNNANAAISGGVLFGNGTTAQIGYIFQQTSGALTLGAQFSSNGFFQINANGSVQAAPLINAVNTLGTLPPTYTAAGASRGSTAHMVFDQVTGAAGGTTTVTLSGAAVFSNASSYVVTVFDLSASAPKAITNIASGSSFTFTSTTGNLNQFIAVGY